MSIEKLHGNDSIAVEEFMEKINLVYGNNISKVVLYGSKVRGESRKWSDIDMIVVLKEMKYKWVEFRKVMDIVREINYKHEVVISNSVLAGNEYITGSFPVWVNTRREGIELRRNYDKKIFCCY